MDSWGVAMANGKPADVPKIKRLSRGSVRGELIRSAFASFSDSNTNQSGPASSRGAPVSAADSAMTKTSAPPLRRTSSRDGEARRRGMRAHLVSNLLQQSWHASATDTQRNPGPEQPVAATPRGSIPLEIPRHRGSRGAFLMTAVLHWRFLRSPDDAPRSVNAERKPTRSRLPSRESDAASDAATETASEQKWSCEYENRLPPGLGLTIPAAEVLTFAKYHG